MQSLSAEPIRPRRYPGAGLRDRVRAILPYLVGLAATLSAAMGGAAAALSPNLAIVGAVGIVGATVLAFASSAWSLAGVLIVRGLTDATAEMPIVAGLNAGAVVGLVLIASAAGLMGARMIAKDLPMRGLAVTIVLVGATGYWFGIGFLQYGMDQSLIRELVRVSSVIAVGLIAANSDRSVTASRLGMIVVLAALIPAILVFQEAVLNWSEMVGGELRPRGTMSHPNSAAILFGIAAPIAIWKAMHDGGGVRYLFAAVFFIAAVLLTRSTGGLAQILIALLALGAVENRRPAYRVGALVIVALIVGQFVFDPLGISRVSEFESTELERSAAVVEAPPNSFEWRLINWRRLLDRWEDAPLLGHGLGSTDEIVSPLNHLPHSDPVRFLVETGALGLTLISAAYLLVIRRLLRMMRRGPHASFAGATLATVVGVSTHGLVTHVSFNTAPVYVFVALLAWLLTTREDEELAEPLEPRTSVFQRDAEARAAVIARRGDLTRRPTASTSGQPQRSTLNSRPHHTEE